MSNSDLPVRTVDEIERMRAEVAAFDRNRSLSIVPDDMKTIIPIADIGKISSPLRSIVTTETFTNASVGEGVYYSDRLRTGGVGQYGNALFVYSVSDATPAGEFDCGLTNWNSHYNLSGGQLIGGWDGANSPSTGLDYSGNPISEVWTGGGVIGREINAGNRYADFGLQYTRGSRFTAILQLVPDVVPAADGPPTFNGSTPYPGTFGTLYAKSQYGHKLWVGEITEGDTINPGGIGKIFSGGTTASLSPQCFTRLQYNFQDIFDLTNAVYTGIPWKINYNPAYFTGSVVAGSADPIPNPETYYKFISVDGTVYGIPLIKLA